MNIRLAVLAALVIGLPFARGQSVISPGGISSISSGGTNGALYRDSSGAIVSTSTGGAGTLCLTSANGGVPVFGSCAGSASTDWGALANPTTNMAINVGTHTSIITAAGNTGTNAVLDILDTTGNTGTGSILEVHSVGTSAAKPFTATAKGTANGIQVDNTGALAAIGTGAIAANTVTGFSPASGKALTLSNSFTTTATDASTIAFGAGGTVAYVANNLSVFAATTSAQLAGVVSDETGSGLLVFGTSPTIVTPTIASFTNATHGHTNASGGGTLAEAALALTDITTNNASTSNHGFLLKLDNNSAHFMNGQGAWATPAGGGSGCVPSGTIGQVLVDSGSGTCTSSPVTIDTTAGRAGGTQMGQGTASTPAANSIVLQAPTSVTTAYSIAFPSATGTGFFLNTDTSNVGALTFIGFTGTANVVRATSPTLVTPTLGAALATSINGAAITSTTGGTLTLANSSTLATSGANSITLTSTGSTNVTLPTSGTLVNSAVTTLSSLASIGTVTTGVWQGTAVAAGFGGTSFSTYTKGDILCASGSTTLTKLAVAADGLVVTADAASTCGVKWAAAGGGGLSGLVSGQMVVGTSTTTVGPTPGFLYSNPAANANLVEINAGSGQGSSITVLSMKDSAGTQRERRRDVGGGDYRTEITALWEISGTKFRVNGNGFNNNSAGIYSFSSGTDSSSGVDTAMSRCAAGTTCFGTGAQGSTGGVVNPAAMLVGGTKFTTSGCSISSTTGGASAGKFTLGANTCSAVITINGATGITATNGWSCYAQDQTAPTILIQQSASSTTTATFSVPAGAGATDVIAFGCVAY